jgi:hypothetical protein
LTSRLFKTLLRWLAGVPKNAGMFVAMDRRMRDRLIAMQGPDPFVVAMIGCSGLPARSIPVARRPRPCGVSAYGSRARLRAGWRALKWTVLWKWNACWRRTR